MVVVGLNKNNNIKQLLKQLVCLIWYRHIPILEDVNIWKCKRCNKILYNDNK